MRLASGRICLFVLTQAVHIHQGAGAVVTGMTADTLAPMNLTNRAQAAVIFQRFDLAVG